MIDYKLVLILVLIIVLLIIYNKVEELRQEIIELKKYNDKEKEKEKNIYISTSKEKKTSDELLKLFKTQNLGIVNNEKCELPICNNEKCELPKTQNMNNTFILTNDNTESYNATEESDSLNINYEKTTSENKGFVIYSNDKNDNIIQKQNNILNTENVLESIQQQNKNNIFIKKNNDIMINSELLDSYPNKNLIEIIKDSSNSDNNIMIYGDDEDDDDELIDNNSDCKVIMNELDNIQILENINGNIIIKNKNINNNIIESYSNSEDKSEDFDGLINTSEFKKISLNSITKYKLTDLQKLAIKYDIIVTKDKNGKPINKTKKELYGELTIFKDN